MRDRWTERDRQLKATLTEKTTQTLSAPSVTRSTSVGTGSDPSAPASMPRGDSTTSSSSATSQVGPMLSLSGSGNPTAGAGVNGSGNGKLDSPGLRATRETSMSYY